MFSGIIESIGVLKDLTQENNNLTLTIASNFIQEITIGDSVSHNGICLTVTNKNDYHYNVVATQETINKTNLKSLHKGCLINLERAIKATSRLDGHIVQGHVDDIGTCTEIKELGGSYIFTFNYNPKFKNLLIEKGSIALNGISLTTINVTDNIFSVSIIPHTFQNTNLHKLQPKNTVNIEFDIIGKYICKLSNKYL